MKVGEPTIEDTIQVLRGIKKYYEDYHRVKVSDFMVERLWCSPSGTFWTASCPIRR